MSPDRYDTAIDNIRETVKWLTASIGAIFVTLLAGVQFNQVPFVSDWLAALGGMLAAAAIMVTFWLAIRTLVWRGLSFRELAEDGRYASTRRFINRNWAGDEAGDDTLAKLWLALERKDAELKRKEIVRTEPGYVNLNSLADELLRAARWHIIKSRFDKLVWAMILLVPAELAAAQIMFAGADAPLTGTTITFEIKGPGQGAQR